MRLSRTRRPGRYAICAVLAAAGAGVVARFADTGSRRAALIAASRRHNPHLAHGPLAGQLDADLFVIFALSFGFLLALACFATWLVTRRRDLDLTGLPAGKTRRRGRGATVPPASGYAPFNGSGYWYGGPQ
jgi:hypothetical protein